MSKKQFVLDSKSIKQSRLGNSGEWPK